MEDSTIKVHTFEENLLGCPVAFHVMKMKESLFIWIGDQGNFDSLAVAMSTPYNSAPISSSLMGPTADESSCSLASRLSKKIGKQVFASYNISQSDSNLMLYVTQRLIQEMTDKPEYF
ncbi:proteasome assembly chaperone 4-like [Argiope bruennichi]|uniref:Proteasome assembly chaperone 4 like protein n=1 Tax=Argiope bruennichi TaxID=94029 RepID=A0A8T0G712_ARGBR|nr:proteasome assembly chaperone 4-like [Argiope bruennichi]KAF8797033.1 Proteasome assembly chaperone 4 like protein [Argiope bruennichi]